MQVDFQDNYIVVVVVFMVVLWFARNFLEMLQAICGIVDKCSFCCGRECLGYSAQQICSTCSRQTLAVFCFMQPLIVCLIGVLNRMRGGDFDSTVQLCTLQVNSSALVYKHGGLLNGTSVVQLNADSSCVEVDLTFIVLPFACMVSISTLSWVKVTSSGDLYQESVWDDTVYEAGEQNSVFFYDLTYFAEIWWMNFAFIISSSSENAFWHLYYVVQALTMGVVFFVAGARFRHSLLLEQWVATLFLLYVLSVLIPYWNHDVQDSCVASIAIAMTHAFCVFVIVAGHYISQGAGTAGYIITLRIIVTVIASLAIIILLLVGRNASC